MAIKKMNIASFASFSDLEGAQLMGGSGARFPLSGFWLKVLQGGLKIVAKVAMKELKKAYDQRRRERQEPA